MLQEINNFMNSLPAELKQAGLKPKEGLHVLLKIQEKEGTLREKLEAVKIILLLIELR